MWLSAWPDLLVGFLMPGFRGTPSGTKQFGILELHRQLLNNNGNSGRELLITYDNSYIFICKIILLRMEKVFTNIYNTLKFNFLLGNILTTTISYLPSRYPRPLKG